jgi:ribose/xylose/arabinose/galactoside ABC-type transport system permease subunit
MSIETVNQNSANQNAANQNKPASDNPIGKAINIVFGRYGIVVALAILCAILTVHSENVHPNQVFLTSRNILQVMLQASINIIIAVGMTFVITTGGIDLSVGSTVAFAGVFIATIAKEGAAENASTIMQILGHPVGLLVVGFVVGAVCGAINGALITMIKLPPFIVTLGTMGIFRGATMIVTGGRPVTGLPQSYTGAITGQILGIHTPIIIALVIAVVFWFVLTRTRFGEYTIALGGNEETARLSGIRVNVYKALVYTLCGALAGVAAVILTARVSAAEAIAGQNYELDAIAATVIGGTSLMGGEGTIFGTVIGGLLMSVVRNGMNLFNVQVYWQQVIIGVVIVLAVTLDRLKKQN